MEPHKSQAMPSPSASSSFLSLGQRSRRDSRASNNNTQADSDALNDALDQAHLSAYQSDTLTTFDEYTEPPDSSVADNKSLVGDLHGGLSGLYSKFRASVGGMRDIVGASSRAPDSVSAEISSAKSPKISSFPPGTTGPAPVGAADTSPLEHSSGQGSKVQSPTVETHAGTQDGQGTSSAPKMSRLSSKAGSMSSKSSGPSNSAMKSSSSLAPLTTLPDPAAVDPAAAELNSDAVRGSPHHSRTESGKLSAGALQRADSPSIERRDKAQPTSGGTTPQDRSVHRAPRSPEMVAKMSRDIRKHREGPELGEPARLPAPMEPVPYEGPASPTKGPMGNDRPGLTELDTSFQSAQRKAGQGNGDSETSLSRHGNHQGDSVGSLPADTSSSVTNSVSKLSTGGSSNQEGETPATLDTSLTMTDKEQPSRNSSKASIQKEREKQTQTPRVGQPRLPGFEFSRKTSSGTVATHSTAAGSQTANIPENRPANQLSRHHSGPFLGQSNAGEASAPGLKSKLLGKEFWMRDENAKDCFYCGEPFSTFRRKHHCRTCGQIFDAKCTSLVPGAAFGHSGSIRLCRPCEAVVNAREEDSSESSSDELSPIVNNTRASDTLPYNIGSRLQADDDDSSSIMSQSVDQVLKTPTMAIPATRRPGDGNNRRSAILEIDADRQLARPTSSRSLRSSLGARTHSVSHKRHHSRQQYVRGFKPNHEDRAPFQRRTAEDVGGERRLPAFHRDNIIDPDLAEYLSDDASSGDEEQPSLFGVVSEGALSKNGVDNERSSFGGLLAAVKKGRSRGGEKSGMGGSFTARDGDDASISSSKAVNLPPPSRRRNLSVASSAHQRLSPRGAKDNPPFVHNLNDHPVPPFSLQASQPGGFKMTRSSSLRGASAPPVELNRASMDHVRKLLRQLLTDSDIPHAQNWETALLPILLKATDDVDPDVQHGDDMDIRHYVKLKRIPGGRPGDTSYVSGLVFTKNVALKSMPRSITRPNILIITFALEYARQQQHFMSLEPVIRQEREFLQNLVNRIAALRPHLLLVEKNISGLALQLLEEAGIATAYNVKPAIIEAVSRCTQTRIVTSMDRLASSSAHPGQCGSFDVKTYVHKNRKKTYMYISGCPKQLGCTIVLRGADDDVLANVKRITEFMVYVVYNLKLETCLMRDEFAKIPTSPSAALSTNKATITNGTQPDSMADGSTGRGHGNVAAMDESLAEAKNSEKSRISQETHVNDQGLPVHDMEKPDLPDDLPTPAFYEDIVQKHQTKILSASPFVKFKPPHPLMRARELEKQLAYLKRLRDQDVSKSSEDEKSKSQKFVLVTPEMIHKSPSDAPAKVKEVLHAVHDAEYDRALHNYETQKKQWETYISGNSNLFDPYAHQNIVVLYSMVCTTTSIPCSGPDVFALGFYNEHDTDTMFESDCTLGQYVEDLCHSANSVCDANGCEERMFDHHRQYVHGETQISVFVQPYQSKLRGLQDTILMWSRCKICGNETPPMPMSESTWKYSFGKYLELSFSSGDLHARAGVCPHDLHRDHLRFFGYKDLALRIHYDPINILEIIVPRPRVTWKVDRDLRLRNDIYTKTEKRLNRFMVSVKARLKSINVESVIPEVAESCKNEIDTLSKRASDEHVALIKQLQERYINSKYWEITPLNRLIRATQEKSVEWDAIFAEFERNYLPSEKDIRLLANLQLKKIFLDRDVSVSSVTSTDEASTTNTSPEESAPQQNESPRVKRRMTLSAKEAKNVLTSVVEEHSGKINKDKDKPEPSLTESPVPPVPEIGKRSQTSPMHSGSSFTTDVQHLDLAVPSERQSSTPVESVTEGEAATRSTETSDAGKGQRESSESPKPGTEEKVGNQYPGQKIASMLQVPPTEPRASAIPRPSLTEGTFRQSLGQKSPPLVRSHSQPPQHFKTTTPTAEQTTPQKHETRVSSPKPQPATAEVPTPTKSKEPKGDKRLAERLGLPSFKPNKLSSGHSLIPRSVAGKKGSRVSSLAKHFEQLSREFEKERQREREQRVGRGKQSRAYPTASSKPIVQVYKNVRDAVEERGPSDEGFQSNVPSAATSKETTYLADDMAKEALPAEKPREPHQEGKEHQAQKTGHQDEAGHGEAKSRESDESQRESGRSVSGGEEDDDIELIQLVESPDELKTSPESEELHLDLKELPKHENSLVKMLTSFWAERTASGWTPLDYPLSDGDHVFADSDIIVREDEPSSLIAFALDSGDYKLKLSSFQEQRDGIPDANVYEADSPPGHAEVEQSLLSHTGTHLKYQFQEGNAKMLCKVFYAKQFDALRRKCGVSERIVESLSRCLKWDSKGGKTKSLFLKTLDDRFILKSLSTIETQAFLKFAPAYFQIMSEALFHELPSAIAKMFGFYQVIIKNPVTGVEFNWFLLVMENLFYDRSPTRIFDLKGSMRNRKVQSTGQRNEVLLDENMVEYIYESPLFAREHSKKLLSQSVWNDTLFLARQNVMDYSLMIAIDESRQELVVGIIDCIRTYTWDKKLESWIKDRGFTGGGKNRPTVTSPKEYKSRFREAMARYVLHAPK